MCASPRAWVDPRLSGTPPHRSAPRGNVSRFVELDTATGAATRELACITDRIQAVNQASANDNGTSEILSIGDDRFLVVEHLVGLGGEGERIRVYTASFAGAAEVSGPNGLGVPGRPRPCSSFGTPPPSAAYSTRTTSSACRWDRRSPTATSPTPASSQRVPRPRGWACPAWVCWPPPPLIGTTQSIACTTSARSAGVVRFGSGAQSDQRKAPATGRGLGLRGLSGECSAAR